MMHMKWKKGLSVVLASLLLGSSAALTASALEPFGNNVQIRYNANTNKYSWTNKEGYTFSEGYKSSVWYENFTSLQFTGNTRNDILSIALSQLGYHEGENDSEDYTGSNTSGSGNSVEYYRLIIPNWSKNSDEWCACFVNWCLSQAHVDYAYGEIGCWKWVQELKTRKMFENSAAYGGTYTPQPADMIFFHWADSNGATNNNGSSHIGFVLYTTETEVYTIEGNAGQQVMIRSYALDDPEVIGYGAPRYEEHTIEGIPQDPSVPTIDHSYKDGMPRGEYVVNAAGLNLYKTPDTTTRLTRIPLGKRVILIGETGEYAHVSYGEKEGYVLKKNLYLLTEVEGEDTLSYDANGGEGAPDAQSVPYGTSATVGDAIPTLEGDTFLGWSLVPHNYKVDYKAGDAISLQGNTTLYAVWEKRSFTLATDALAKGDVAEFERPESITNTGALWMGSSELLDFIDTTDGGDTKAEIVDAEGAWGGKALSLQSTQKSSDPYVFFRYADLCGKLQLAPTSPDTVDYVILRVKNVSLYNTATEVFFDCVHETEVSASGLLASTDDWQYLVLDMTKVDFFEGELRAMRIDWSKASDDAGNTMLLDGIYFAANEAQRDAIVTGKYIYPVQPIVIPPETEPETVPETEPETMPATKPETVLETESGTVSETLAESGTTAETEAENTGCASAAGVVSVLTLVTLGGALMLKKKKD